MRRFVLTHPDFGVYIGSVGGHLMWSTDEGELPILAMTFENRQHCEKYFRQLGIELAHECRLRPVLTAFCEGWAHVGECIHAGLGGWDCQTIGNC